MFSTVDITLNVAAGVLVAILIATTVREDFVRFFYIGYAVFFVVAFLVPAGGQVNVAVALGMVSHALLTWVSDDKDKPGPLVKQRETVRIFKGVIGAKANVGLSYNTYDPSSASYKRLPRSVNRMGGAQFSYSFWISFERGVADEKVAGKTIFMRGEDKLYSPMASTPEEPDTPNVKYFGDSADYVIACPRVSFLTMNKLAVDINTDRDIRRRFVVGSDESDPALRKNALSLVPGHFTLITLTFEDNVGVDSFERGIRMRMFLNDHLYSTGVAEGSLRQNDAPLHLFLDNDPSKTEGIDGLNIADLTYYNFALSEKDVASLYSKGFTNQRFSDFDTLYSKDSRLVADAYNKMDLGVHYDNRLHLSGLPGS